MLDLKALIRDIPGFPKAGIVFRDITPLLADGPAWRETVNRIAERYRGRVDIVLGVESRGFLVGSAVAYALGCGIAVVRKPGKLPAATFNARYTLEYGTDALEIHRDAFPPHSRVLVVDDLLATGGTAQALAELIEGTGAKIAGCAFLVELAFLGGRQRLADYNVHTLLSFDE
jgi:adenine phosphoribosyltransferase